MEQLAVTNPVVVLEDGDTVIVADGDQVAINFNVADSQSYNTRTRQFSRVVQVASWLKFQPWLQEVKPFRKFAQ